LLARTAQAYADAPLAGHSFYHCDGNGNITMLIDSSQGIVARYLYDAFGNTISASGLLANANVYRFSSKEWHQNSGLAYYGYRYYDPNLQRWLNRDPIGESGFDTLRRRDDSADTHEANSYEFVHNDPVDKLDPNGLFIWLCTRHVAGFPFVGTHAYLWDDTTKTSCGMRGSFGLGPTSGSQDTGPGTAGQSCQKVGGSAGLESGIMACCKGTANYGLWRPFQNDCHNAAERCLTGAGLNPPLNPRFGPPPGF
jgi:RHS repeat-associated protein